MFLSNTGPDTWWPRPVVVTVLKPGVDGVGVNEKYWSPCTQSY